MLKPLQQIVQLGRRKLLIGALFGIATAAVLALAMAPNVFAYLPELFPSIKSLQVIGTANPYLVVENSNTSQSLFILDNNANAPLAPTNFAAAVDDNDIDLTWTSAAGATHTVIRQGEATYPTNREDGTLTAFVTGNRYIDEGATTEGNVFYYSAWSYSSLGYSVNYVTASAGGTGMILIAIVVLVLGLTIAAFFIKSGMLYVVCVPAWLIFTFIAFNTSWPGENTYLPTAIAIFGVAMTILMMATTVMHYVGNQSSEPSYDEEKASNAARIYKLTHNKSPWED